MQFYLVVSDSLVLSLTHEPLQVTHNWPLDKTDDIRANARVLAAGNSCIILKIEPNIVESIVYLHDILFKKGFDNIVQTGWDGFKILNTLTHQIFPLNHILGLNT